MPYDPAFPVEHTEILAEQFRDQFQGLKQLIDAVPAGPPGDPGPPGNDGGNGPAGPPFAQAVVDDVTTLDPGQPATVEVSFDGTDVHFSYGIPRGENGSNGSDGSQGPPGEVTLAQLADAVAGSSANTNAVALLNLTVSDPPTQSEMQAIADRLDLLLLTARR